MELNSNFSINSEVCSVGNLESQESNVILDGKTKYIVPVYQRPYEWADDQIEKFVNGIFESFWGQDKKSEPEPLFYGTIQLSVRDKYIFEIIDGQQRLTTILLIILVLKALNPENKKLKKIKFDWLKTEVNKGKEQEYLYETLEFGTSVSTLKIDKRKKEPNLYKKNAVFIKDIIINIFDSYSDSDDIDEPLDLNIIKDNFVDYLFSNIFFVVLKTKTSLSKTIQIFKAINTSGLSLGEEDIFKVRIYEYLQNKKNCNEDIFDEINSLYRYIKDENEKGDKTSIGEILDIYKYIIIAHYKLSPSLYAYATDTFFEQLFDTMSNIKTWDLFEKKKIDKIDLSLKEIRKIIEARYNMYKISYKSAEAVCANNFIWSWTRYHNFWFLPAIFLYKFGGQEPNIISFIVLLNKIYILYSIWHTKAVKEIKDFSYELVQLILKGSSNQVIGTLKEKINESKNYYDELVEKLTGDISSNKKFRGMICRLSAMLHEDYTTKNKEKIFELEEKIFELNDIDIEHIQSLEDKAGNRIDNIWKTWGVENINSLGNLMILESRINRQIKDKPYSEKIIKYAKSGIKIVREQPRLYSEWNLENCKKRKEIEVKKILEYLL
jgi:uncharacterized protein with ParB-like and HNH nuclease domain